MVLTGRGECLISYCFNDDNYCLSLHFTFAVNMPSSRDCPLLLTLPPAQEVQFRLLSQASQLAPSKTGKGGRSRPCLGLIKHTFQACFVNSAISFPSKHDPLKPRETKIIPPHASLWIFKIN